MRCAAAAALGLGLITVLLAGCASMAHPAHPAPPAGRALFTRECSSCHSLSGREDPRRQGGDLLEFRSSRTALVQLTREMPVRRPLSVSALQAVVDYVMSVERRGHQ
jgi:mono/diheme cytochrome c family protein